MNNIIRTQSRKTTKKTSLIIQPWHLQKKKNHNQWIIFHYSNKRPKIYTFIARAVYIILETDHHSCHSVDEFNK